jgi:hypothetical protein
LLRSLSIPLLQHLLISIASDDQWHVELYSAAVISQCSACSTNVYSELSVALYAGFSKDKIDDEVIDNLALFLQCMRISCHDLGHSEHAAFELQLLVSDVCQRLEEQTNQTQLMGYSPDSNALEQARIDLDILQIGIFMRTRAYEAASDYYKNGLNSFAPQALKTGDYGDRSLLSLQSLATLPERVQIDQIDLFSRYYGSDTYADDIIMQCVQRIGVFHNASRTELAGIVTRTLQTMVSYVAILWQFELSVRTCEKEIDIMEAIDSWSSGVAFFLGSIDLFSPDRPPSDGGFLLHSLGIEQCSRFGTCNDIGESNANEALFAYFEEGKHFLTERRCDEVQNLLVSNILPLLHVPLVQGILYHSIPDHNIGEAVSGDISAEGYMFAQSILPLVDEANAESGRTIANLFHSPLHPIATNDGTGAVFDTGILSQSPSAT